MIRTYLEYNINICTDTDSSVGGLSNILHETVISEHCSILLHYCGMIRMFSITNFTADSVDPEFLNDRSKLAATAKRLQHFLTIGHERCYHPVESLGGIYSCC